MVQVQRGGHELANLIPKERHIEKPGVRNEHQRSEETEKQRVGPRRDNPALSQLFLDRHSGYCTTLPPDCGSSLISPNVPSYCETFCCSTLSSALACCGLTYTP